MSDSSLHSLWYVPEASYGVTPATPVFSALRQTSCSLGVTKNTIVSAEAKAHGQIQDLRHGAKSVSGDVGFELSYGSFDDLLSACFLSAWASDTLKVGTTRSSFTIQRRFGDAVSGQYHTFTGCEVTSMDVSVAADNIATGTVSIVGRDLSIASSQIAGATDAAVSVTSPFDSFSGAIKEGGITIGIVTEIKIKIDNKLTPRFVVGSALTSRPSRSRLMVTGDLTVYFDDSAMLNKFLAETESSVEFTLTSGTDSLTFTIPRLKYTGGKPDTQSEGAITLAMPFQGLYDGTELTTIKVVRS